MVGWSDSGSSTLGPLCVCCLQPAYFPQSLPRNISPACFAKLLKKILSVFFFLLKRTPILPVAGSLHQLTANLSGRPPHLLSHLGFVCLLGGPLLFLYFVHLLLYLQQSWLLQVLPTWKSCCREVSPPPLSLFFFFFPILTSHQSPLPT